MSLNEAPTITLTPRSIQKKKVRQLRREGILPAAVYGKGIEPIAVQVSAKDFLPILKKCHGTSILNARIGQKSMQVLIHEVQRARINNNVLHIDFMKVNLKDKVTVEIPVVLCGQAPVEISGKGRVSQETSFLQIRCPASDIPEQITVDIATITAKDQSIHGRDLNLPKGIKLAHPSEEDAVIITVLPFKSAEPEAEPPATTTPEMPETPQPESV